MIKTDCDVVVVGSGVAGLICALELSEKYNVILITKKCLEDSNSYLAQGGISIRKGKKDRESFIQDTLSAGHFLNNKEAVEILVDESEDALKSLLSYGIDFNTKDSSLAYTREGGHSKFRIVYHEDITGKAVMEGLINKVKSKKNIKIVENCSMKDIIEFNNTSYGIIVNYENDGILIHSNYTVLATGGTGGLYKNSTSFPHIKGDGIGVAIKHGIKVKDISNIQIHPTSLYEDKIGRRFLISESVRGEGAKILNNHGKRFIDELKPRDIVSKAIFEEMKKENSKYEWLNLRTINKDINIRFPNICEYLSAAGIDPKKENVPIVPAHHYTIGGISVDMNSKTSMDRLYAIGEVSNTGVHGSNRLASNSLLECIVFGKRAAKDINSKFSNNKLLIDLDNYTYSNNEDYEEMVKKRIEEDENSKVKLFSN